MAILTWLGVPGDEQAWTALGFTVNEGSVQIGRVCCELTRDRSWGFDEIYGEVTPLEVPTAMLPAMTGPAHHPCGVTHVDHVVYAVRDLDTATTALTAALGTAPRRRFHPRGPKGPEMAFYRAGEAFIEVVATATAPSLIGLALWTADLDATVTAIRAAGGPIGDPKPAVQGGRIATVGHGHLDWGLAIMGR
ncbi:VOC family protein [Mycolicibacter sp. MYC123]|uniref:VOC family protein n=1 Tax=[Mycobacterium] zoologicum TaxID=2872311 RepID=A0ABU5YIH4_9MYCO|nr:MULTISPECIES: VOC family protein [unclassified Mycolicibacter]MEB3049852.1 VOC family protein [Mycolicibacter sp. MYC123]MEB3063277.1 VOC family protein [Mycolicibacter sp. MYC101]